MEEAPAPAAPPAPVPAGPVPELPAGAAAGKAVMAGLPVPEPGRPVGRPAAGADGTSGCFCAQIIKIKRKCTFSMVL